MVLGLSSSTEFFSLALFDEKKNLLAEEGYWTRKLQENSIDAIDKILKNNNISLKDLSKIVIDTGPGGLTGLRIGVMLAKTLAYSLNIPLCEVSSLSLLSVACGVYPNIASMDGKQGRWFAQIFYSPTEFSEVMDMSWEKLLQKTKDYSYSWVGERPDKQEKDYPHIKNACFLPWKEQDAFLVNPRYYRKTQAEENSFENTRN